MKHSKKKNSIGKNLHKGITFSIGLVTIGLVLWGMISLGMGVYRMFRPAGIYAVGVDPYFISGASPLLTRLSETEAESEEYFETLLQNFVRQDFPDFATAEELNDDYLISFGLWQAITLQNTDGVFNYGESGNILVPGNMVEKLSTYYFDRAEKLHHRSVELCGSFAYNQLNGCYTITAAGVSSYLLPDVVSITKSEDGTSVTLVVDCYESSGMEEGDVTENQANFRKRVEITLQNVAVAEPAEVALEESRYMFTSLKTVQRTEAPTTDKPTTETTDE